MQNNSKIKEPITFEEYEAKVLLERNILLKTIPNTGSRTKIWKIEFQRLSEEIIKNLKDEYYSFEVEVSSIKNELTELKNACYPTDIIDFDSAQKYKDFFWDEIFNKYLKIEKTDRLTDIQKDEWKMKFDKAIQESALFDFDKNFKNKAYMSRVSVKSYIERTFFTSEMKMHYERARLGIVNMNALLQNDDFDNEDDSSMKHTNSSIVNRSEELEPQKEVLYTSKVDMTDYLLFLGNKYSIPTNSKNDWEETELLYGKLATAPIKNLLSLVNTVGDSIIKIPNSEVVKKINLVENDAILSDLTYRFGIFKELDEREYMVQAIEQMYVQKEEMPNLFEALSKDDKKKLPFNEYPIIGAILVDEKGYVIAKSHKGCNCETFESSVKHHCEYLLFNHILEDKDLAKNGKLYCTLEPCNRRGLKSIKDSIPKLPCAVHCLESGISEVCIGLYDVNEDVMHQGKKILESGIYFLSEKGQHSHSELLIADYFIKKGYKEIFENGQRGFVIKQGGVKVSHFHHDLAVEIARANYGFIQAQQRNKRTAKIFKYSI